VKAAEWTARAAQSGLVAAQIDYAIMLFKGRGVTQDRKAAAAQFKAAAEAGNPVAQNRLARLYAHGAGVEADRQEAAKWHLLARQAGVSDFWLDLELAKLTQAERDAAEKAAQDWMLANIGR
jgi:TPR repeat protein